MQTDIKLTSEPIPKTIPPSSAGAHGAWLEFRGVVRGEESGKEISALQYDAYPEMAIREMRRLLEEISSRHPCLTAKIIHRIGIIPIGETAIYVGVESSHRAEAIALLAEFMDRLKQDVPIWKHRAFQATDSKYSNPSKANKYAPVPVANPPGFVTHARPIQKALNSGPVSLDDAVASIAFRCSLLPPVALPLEECFGHVLHETVLAPTDLPDCDRSTRDGYAVLRDDGSDAFQIVDTLHAADWKPRQLEPGQAVRVATGASMPCPDLRVVMQENVKRDGDKIRIVKPDADLNIRRRGEEIKAGATLVEAGARLDAGHLALLASAGCVRPRVNRRLRVIHFTTGDEVVPPDQTPKPGQIRDSNSILIRALLQRFPCNLVHRHLPEDFEKAAGQISNRVEEMDNANVVIISGGASVGDTDFTRRLLESLGFEIIFAKVAIRPGRPTMFGVNGKRIAFGLPGNPLAHFVCFHLFVAPALARLSGGVPNRFLRGWLAQPLLDAENPRETLWPARLQLDGGGSGGSATGDCEAGLHPLAWSSSGDVTCLVEANALLRVPPNCSGMETGAELDFLPTW